MPTAEPVVLETTPDVQDTERPAVRGLWRWMYLLLGFLNLGLAYLGWLLPGLPCTPFVLMASLCFGKASPRLQRWLLHNKLFGQYLRDFQEHRGMRCRIKIRASLLIVIVVSCSVGMLIYAGQPWYMWAALPVLAGIGLLVIWRWVVTLPDK